MGFVHSPNSTRISSFRYWFHYEASYITSQQSLWNQFTFFFCILFKR